MNKNRRNQPCPCGSEKKFKKCCGSTDGLLNNPKVVDQELTAMHQHLVMLVSNQYKNEIIKVTQRSLESSNLKHTDVADIYKLGLISWVIAHQPMVKGGQTIIDIVFNQMKLKMLAGTREKLTEWRTKSPSVYQVVSLNESGGVLVVCDILTDEIYKVPVYEKGYLEDSFLVGTLVPYMNHHSFLYTTVTLYHREKAVLAEQFRDFAMREGGLVQHYPKFLLQVLNDGVEAAKLDLPIYEEVVEVYVNRMVEKNVPQDIIVKGFDLWKEYCERERPLVKKVETFAAALEYMVHKLYLSNKPTQSQIAKEYRVSISSVSINYRKISECEVDELAS